MIILMLFIRMTLQILHNGLIILTFIWSLLRMVILSHDYGKRDFPMVNVPYLSSNIPESPAYGMKLQTTFRKFYGHTDLVKK